jgi:hypothetical protein
MIKNLKGSDHLDDLGLNRRVIILKQIFKKFNGRVWNGFFPLSTGTSDGFH